MTVDDLSLSFGDLSVLEGVSLTVKAGEFVGLVGPNGAGKTTLLRAISGALDPDSGTVEVDGVEIHGVSSRTSSRLVATVPQDTTLSFSFPVRDVVEMGRHPHRSRFSSPTAADRAAVESALERTRTADLADRPIDEVSGGQRQRVVLARAIAQETPVLVLDEPTANLDVNHQIGTLELVRRLVDEGKTVVAAIHDLELAARYCDRLALLADGSIDRSGPPSTVMTGEALADAFGANAVVLANPVTGTETVTALGDGRETDRLPNRVHVFGTGSAAVGVVARLEAAGIEPTLGPVPDGGMAAETAGSLGVDALAVEPFEPLSAGARTTAERLVRKADVAVCVDRDGVGGTILERVDESTALETTPETVPEVTPETVLDTVGNAVESRSQPTTVGSTGERRG
nr:ATP-binding cassette domain-containing protein [Halopiger djelfimassiliensis]